MSFRRAFQREGRVNMRLEASREEMGCGSQEVGPTPAVVSVCAKAALALNARTAIDRTTTLRRDKLRCRP